MIKDFDPYYLPSKQARLKARDMEAESERIRAYIAALTGGYGGLQRQLMAEIAMPWLPRKLTGDQPFSPVEYDALTKVLKLPQGYLAGSHDMLGQEMEADQPAIPELFTKGDAQAGAKLCDLLNQRQNEPKGHRALIQPQFYGWSATEEQALGIIAGTQPLPYLVLVRLLAMLRSEGIAVPPVKTLFASPDLALAKLVALLDTPDRQKAFGKLVRLRLTAAGVASQAEAARRLGYPNRGTFNNALDGRLRPKAVKAALPPKLWRPDKLQALLELCQWDARQALAETRKALDTTR